MKGEDDNPRMPESWEPFDHNRLESAITALSGLGKKKAEEAPGKAADDGEEKAEAKEGDGEKEEATKGDGEKEEAKEGDGEKAEVKEGDDEKAEAKEGDGEKACGSSHPVASPEANEEGGGGDGGGDGGEATPRRSQRRGVRTVTGGSRSSLGGSSPPKKKSRKPSGKPPQEPQEGFEHEPFQHPDYQDVSYLHTSMSDEKDAKVYCNHVADVLQGTPKAVGRAKIVVWPDFVTLWYQDPADTAHLARLAKATHSYLVKNAAAADGPPPMLLVPLHFYCSHDTAEEKTKQKHRASAEDLEATSTVSAANALRRELVFGAEQYFTEIDQVLWEWDELEWPMTCKGFIDGKLHEEELTVCAGKDYITWLTFTPNRFDMEHVLRWREKVIREESWRIFGSHCGSSTTINSAKQALVQWNLSGNIVTPRTRDPGGAFYSHPSIVTSDLVRAMCMPEETEVLMLQKSPSGNDPASSTGPDLDIEKELPLMSSPDTFFNGVQETLAMAFAAHHHLVHIFAYDEYPSQGLACLPRPPADQLFANLMQTVRNDKGKVETLEVNYSQGMYRALEVALLVQASTRWEGKEHAQDMNDSLCGYEVAEKVDPNVLVGDSPETSAVNTTIKAGLPTGKGIFTKKKTSRKEKSKKFAIDNGRIIVTNISVIAADPSLHKDHTASSNILASHLLACRRTFLRIFIDEESIAAKANHYEGLAAGPNACFVERCHEKSERSALAFDLVATGDIGWDEQILVDYGDHYAWPDEVLVEGSKSQAAERDTLDIPTTRQRNGMPAPETGAS